MVINVLDYGMNGEGVSKVDGKVILIENALVGEEVDIDIVKSHKKYDEGRVNSFVRYSEDRIESLCPYYNICGGCNISNLNYSKQLEYKENKIINIFKRYLNIDINPEIIGSDNNYEYRNKITFQNMDGIVGLVSIDNKLINIDKCILVSDKVNELYNVICKEDLSNVRKIVIKECDNGLILGLDGKMNIDDIKNLCLSIYCNGNCVCKNDDGYINVGDIKYRVSMDSFFQVNSRNISRLYDVIVKYGEFKKNDSVIDLYCGVGSISIYISKYVDSVLGIEIIDDAIKDANENAKLNGIKNTKFICGDVSKLVDDSISGNVVIVDPPRVGLDNHTIDVLNSINVDRLIYVSCDPMTLVRDLSKLDSYEIKDITLVDMFPQTHHVESVFLLQRKN